MGWDLSDLPDQRGRTAIVTGANRGLGYIVARELAGAGARVVLACRDTDSGETAAATIRGAASGADVGVMRLDLADLSSVRAFAREYRRGNTGSSAEPGGSAEDAAEDAAQDATEDARLDLLVNNGGVMAVPYRTTADGFELQFGINHLGHFALTGLLLPALLSRPAPRVVTVTSSLHRIGRIDFADVHAQRGYRKWRAYGQSKLANLLFTYELQRRAAAAQLPLASMAAHPGYAATNLQLRGPRMAGSRLQQGGIALANRLLAQSDEMGALPILHAATAPDLPGGSFVGPGGPLEQRGHPRRVESSAAAQDPEAARGLWELSAELTGVRPHVAA